MSKAVHYNVIRLFILLKCYLYAENLSLFSGIYEVLLIIYFSFKLFMMKWVLARNWF